MKNIIFKIKFIQKYKSDTKIIERLYNMEELLSGKYSLMKPFEVVKSVEQLLDDKFTIL